MNEITGWGGNDEGEGALSSDDGCGVGVTPRNLTRIPEQSLTG